METMPILELQKQKHHESMSHSSWNGVVETHILASLDEKGRIRVYGVYLKFYYGGKVRLSEGAGCAAQVLVQRGHARC